MHVCSALNVKCDFCYEFHTSHSLLNTLRPRQKGRHFPDAIFKQIFLNENLWISIKISLKFVRRGPINNIPALVQLMTWRRPSHYFFFFFFKTWLKDLSSDLTKKFSCKSKIVNSHLIHKEWKIMGVLFKIMLKYQSFVTLISLIWYCRPHCSAGSPGHGGNFLLKIHDVLNAKSFDNVSWGKTRYNDNNDKRILK